MIPALYDHAQLSIYTTGALFHNYVEAMRYR